MTIRRAVNGDIPKIHELLEQVCLVHHNGRPDLFKFGARKYAPNFSNEELKKAIKYFHLYNILLLAFLVYFNYYWI